MQKHFLSLIFVVVANVALAQLPAFEWAKAFVAHNQFNPSVYSNGRSVAVDQAGNVYSAGLFDYTTDFDPGPGVFDLSAANWANSAIYLSKLSPAGDFLWAIQIPTYVEWASIELKVGRDNNVYIASELRLPSDFDPGPDSLILTPVGSINAFVAKYNPNGNLIWAKQFGGPGPAGARSDMLDIDSSNNIILCGNFNDSVDFDPGPATYYLTSPGTVKAFLMKLGSNGGFIWAKQFANSSLVNSDAHIADVKCDLQGNIYLTGDFRGSCDFDPGPGTYQLQSQGQRDGYVEKLDPGGNFNWAKSVGNTTQDFYQFSQTAGIEVDANHNVYVAGTFTGTFDFDPGPNTHIVSSSNYDWYILKLNAQGDFVWVDAVGGSEGDFGADVALGNDGSVYAIGSIGPTADMDPGAGVYSITTVYQYGAGVLLKVDSNGSFIAATSFEQVGSNGSNSYPRRMVMNDQQNIYITGYLAGIIDFDPGPNVYPLSSGNTEAPFVLKLSGNNMPVRLLAFVARKQDHHSLLTWHTDKEINTDMFEVERSGTGREYRKVGSVIAGSGSYSFIDYSPLKTVNYYRLKMLDKDGRYSYSGIREVRDNSSLFTVYPNPSKGDFYIDVSAADIGQTSATVIDVCGKQVLQTTLGMERNKIALSKGVSPGLYILHITNPNTHKTEVSELVIDR